jgi:hypothetical protein
LGVERVAVDDYYDAGEAGGGCGAGEQQDNDGDDRWSRSQRFSLVRRWPAM